MTVFISYRHSDEAQATKINQTLKASGIKTYMDKFDHESQNSDDNTITEIITQRMHICTHLLAVMSSETAKSWWVPFEIGEATALSRRITSFRQGYVELPPYLKIWPVMTRDEHLSIFIEEYKKDELQLILTEKQFRSQGSVSMEAFSPSVAKKFHDSLKSRL
jgi:hypothetical protein